MLFADRLDAGCRLADRLKAFPRRGLVVLGLPRGGVPVAFEVARELGAPLDIIVVRKLGLPSQPELAMGAIGEGGVRILNNQVVTLAGVTAEDIDAAQAREEVELARRARRFRGTHERVPLAGCTALIVDDGIATGSTVRAACKVARAQGASRVVVATPVAPRETVASLRRDADDVFALYEPEDFYAIGQFYEDFTQTPDAEVVRLLTTSREAGAVTASGYVPVPDGANDRRMR